MKKIMFNDSYGLTKAVLEGRKTITRRLVPERMLEAYCDYDDYVNAVAPSGIPYSRDWEESFFLVRSPLYVNDVVAIAQSYKDVMEARGESGVSHLVAKAGYKNKMFVKADLMPHQIRITKVRVERLRDISAEDCLKEGIRKIDPLDSCICATEPTYVIDGPGYENRHFVTPRGAYAALIDKVSGRGTWFKNPWVFVYEFELVK